MHIPIVNRALADLVQLVIKDLLIIVITLGRNYNGNIYGVD